MKIVYIPNRIIDSDGIADGATVHVYQSGTTTHVNIYSDPTYSTPMANPFSVAAGAEFPAVYTNYSGDVRLYIENIYSGEIQDTDPYDISTFNLNIQTNNGLPTLNLTIGYYNAILQCTNAISNALTIQSDADMGLNAVPIGTVIYPEQTTSAGTVTLVADSGVTLTGPVTTSAQYQRLEVRKTAANTWQSRLLVQNNADASSLRAGTLDAARLPTLDLPMFGSFAGTPSVLGVASGTGQYDGIHTSADGQILQQIGGSLVFGSFQPVIQTVASAATVTPTFSNDQVNITAQAVGLALANPVGTPISGKQIRIRIKDNGTARAISYGTQYRAIGVTLPTTTVINKTLYLTCIWNATDTKFDVVHVAQEA